MKETYISPDMEIIEFDAEDVITTSFTGGKKAPDVSGSGDIDIQIP